MIKIGKCPKMGETFVRDGKRLTCIVRPKIKKLKDVCRDCYFNKTAANCNDLACSKFDRKDETFVWFVEV